MSIYSTYAYGKASQTNKQVYNDGPIDNKIARFKKYSQLCRSLVPIHVRRLIPRTDHSSRPPPQHLPRDEPNEATDEIGTGKEPRSKLKHKITVEANSKGGSQKGQVGHHEEEEAEIEPRDEV